MSERNFTGNRNIRYIIVLGILMAALIVIIVLNINIGNVSISLKDILTILSGGAGESNAYKIIWMIRLPRLVMAGLLGGALAVSGFLLQTYFGNPIAGPFVLGISSGAKFVVALNMIILANIYRGQSSWEMIGSAFVGAMTATIFIIIVARYVKDAAGLLVAGIMIGYICSAATDFLLTFAEDSDIANLRGWSMGSFSGMSWDNVYVSLSIVSVSILMTFVLSKPIGALQLGEAYARSMGVNVSAIRIAIILISSVLSATVTAFAGPVSFVGIAVPFLVKQMLKTGRPIVVVPSAFLCGAVFTLGCDLIARCVFAPTELNISTVTSIFGAPVVIFMLVNRRKRHG